MGHMCSSTGFLHAEFGNFFVCICTFIIILSVVVFCATVLLLLRLVCGLPESEEEISNDTFPRRLFLMALFKIWKTCDSQTPRSSNN